MERSASRWSFVLPVILFGVVCFVALWATLAALHITMLALHQAVVLFFTVLTLLLHGWVHAAASADSRMMVRRFMASMVVKMMVSLLVLMVLLLTRPKDQVLTLALVFMGCYLAFLVFSTVTSLRLIRRWTAP